MSFPDDPTPVPDSTAPAPPACWVCQQGFGGRPWLGRGDVPRAPECGDEIIGARGYRYRCTLPPGHTDEFHHRHHWFGSPPTEGSPTDG